MSDVEIHAEAVERLARELRRSIGQHEDVRRDAAATLRALRAALDAAEKRAGYLYDGLRATVEAGGGIAQPGVSDEFLVTCTPMEMRAVRRSRDAALAARDAAWRAGRDAAAEWLKMKEATSRSFGSHADAYEIAHRHIAALQPPADLAAEAPGDAVADALREAIQQAHSGIINLGLLDPDGQIEAVRLGLAIALDRDSARAGA